MCRQNADLAVLYSPSPGFQRSVTQAIGQPPEPSAVRLVALAKAVRTGGSLSAATYSWSIQPFTAFPMTSRSPAYACPTIGQNPTSLGGSTPCRAATAASSRS